MKLKSIKIRNFRRFDDVKMDLSDKITALAGANNSGKTSLVQLLDKIFNERNALQVNDITIEKQVEWKTKFLIFLNEVDKENSDPERFINEIVDVVFKEEYVVLLTASVSFDISYVESENISLFAEYLMDLEEENKSFYFQYRNEYNKTYFKKIVRENKTLLKYSMEYLQSDLEINKLRITDIILNLFNKSMESKYYYSNEDFSIINPMTYSDFKMLFHYSYISADRNLGDDEKVANDSLANILIDFMKIPGQDDKDWSYIASELLSTIEQTLKESGISGILENGSRTLLSSLTDNLDSLSGGNLSDIEMTFDYSDNSLERTIKNNIHMNYAFKQDDNAPIIYLNESSQGLGFSNLIYITAQLEKFKKEYDRKKINFFIIEEPESHLHMQMERVLINYLNCELNKMDYIIQGMITTHSNQIVRDLDIRNIRVIRPVKPFLNKICDMSKFIKNQEEGDKTFYETFFRLNFSTLIFCDKAIIYEGDTEKMFIESLIWNRQMDGENMHFKDLSNQYISYIQAGGDFAHKYEKILEELDIRTVIFTDVDYEKNRDNRCDLLQDETSNKCIKYFMQGQKVIMEGIYEWQSQQLTDKKRILMKVQTEKDGYARTLEDALLYNYIKNDFRDLVEAEFDVFTKLSRENWKTIKDDGLEFPTPNGEKISARDVAKSIASNNKKTDFMYSIIMGKKQFKMVPDYIKTGLEWLEE